MKIVSIVGARPEFIQAMPVSHALRISHMEVLVHTGQHYDYEMSQAFFDELDVPSPDYNLGVGSGSQADQTARILVLMEQVLQTESPDLVIVRGDTNSTLASALATSKLQIPTAHIEAGERSYDRRMPEEVNRVVTDALSDLHLCASRHAVKNLSAEGIFRSVHWVGDVMLDAMLKMMPIARRTSKVRDRLGLRPGGYSLVTLHRAANTDSLHRLANIVSGLNQANETIIFPVHPRTRKALAQIDESFAKHVRVIDPVGYLDMIMLEEGARLIATDSGGVQREAYFLGIPCLTLRDETEWVETVDAGWNTLIGVEPEAILDAWSNFAPPVTRPLIFGEGDAGEKIAGIVSTADVEFGKMQETWTAEDHQNISLARSMP